MEELNLLDYKKVGDKMSCAFADECELVRALEDDMPLEFKFKTKTGRWEYFWTTLNGKYRIEDPNPVIYPRKGVYTWENETKVPNYDNLEVLVLTDAGRTYSKEIRIGNEKEDLFYSCVLMDKYSIKANFTDCEAIPKEHWTQGMKDLREKVINKLKRKDNG